MSVAKNGVAYAVAVVVGLLLWEAVPLVERAGQLQAQEADTRTADEVYNDAATLQNNGAYRTASQEWQAFLKRFPKNPMANVARHYLGMALVKQDKFEQAAAEFAAVRKADPKFKELEELLINQGWSHYSLGRQQKDPQRTEQLTTAAKVFQDLVQAYPKGKYTDEALYFQGEALYSIDKKREAVAAYNTLVRAFPKSKRLCETLYALGVALEDTQQYQPAGQTYDKFLAECKESSLVTEVKFRKGECLIQLKDYAAAQPWLIEVSKVTSFAAADLVRMRLGFCAGRLGQPADAAKYYASVAENYPNSTYKWSAMVAAGRSYYQAKDDAAALQWLNMALGEKKSGLAEAAHWACLALLRQRKIDEAIALAQKVTESETEGGYLVNLKLDLGDAQYRQPAGKATAIKTYLALVEQHPKDSLAPQALYNAAFAAMELNQVDQGLALATKFLESYGTDNLVPDVKYVAAECHLVKNAAVEAEKIYRDLVLNYPNHAETLTWHLRLAASLLYQAKYDDLIAHLTPRLPLMKSKAQTAEAQYLIGASQFHQANYEQSVASLQLSLASDTTWWQADEATLYLGRALAAAKKLPQAIGTVTKLIADYPQSRVIDQAQYRLGEFQYAAQAFGEAATAYGKLIANSPNSTYVPYAFYGQGWSLLKSGKADAASVSFTSLIEKYPDHALAKPCQLARGMAYRQAGKPAEAIQDLEAFLATEPKLAQKAEALLERGLAEVALKKWEAAATTFDRLLEDEFKASSGRETALYELAWVRQQQGKADESLDVFRRLAKEFPKSRFAPDAHFRIGESLYKESKYPEAIEAYAAALAGKPSGDLGENAAHMLGWSHYQVKQYEKAREIFAQQMKTHPDGKLYGDGMFMQGESLFKLAKFEEALPVLRAAYDRTLSSEDFQVLALLHAAQAAAQLQKWDYSRELIEPLVAKFPKSPWAAEAYYELGHAQQKLNKGDEARKAYLVAATRSKGAVGARARFMMGELDFSEKMYDAAIGHFERVMYNYGGKEPSAEVKGWQAKAAYEAARCAEVQIEKAAEPKKRGLIADAKKYYSYVISKHPQSDLVKVAQKRLLVLDRL